MEVSCVVYMHFDSDLPVSPSGGHQILWIEIDNYSILEKHIPFINKPIMAGRVKSRNPRSRKRYQNLVKQELHTKKKLQKQAYNFIIGLSNSEKENFDTQIPK